MSALEERVGWAKADRPCPSLAMKMGTLRFAHPTGNLFPGNHLRVRMAMRTSIMNRDRSSLTIDQATLERVCRTHRIRRLSLFGSQLKGTANPDSDVDLLVEFDPGAHPTLLDLAQIEIELSQALGGKKVDVRTPEDLSRFFRDDVLNMAEVQYVAE